MKSIARRDVLKLDGVAALIGGIAARGTSGEAGTGGLHAADQDHAGQARPGHHRIHHHLRTDSFPVRCRNSEVVDVTPRSDWTSLIGEPTLALSAFAVTETRSEMIGEYVDQVFAKATVIWCIGQVKFAGAPRNAGTHAPVDGVPSCQLAAIPLPENGNQPDIGHEV